ncbi:MAG: hypothetical protein ACRDJM_05060, partial [Actinomycetota bacterium]
VRLYEGGIQIGTAPVVGGEWAVTLRFPSGTHSITARSVTPNGVGPHSRPRTFRVDADAPTVHMDRPSGHLIIGRLIDAPLTGDAADSKATDSLLDRVELSYVDIFTGAEVKRIASCPRCPTAALEFRDMAPLLPSVYEVTATAYDVVGNFSTDTLLLLIV